jgi:hypothetical protein
VAVPPQITLAIGAAMSLFAIAFAVAVASSSSSSSSPEVRVLPVPNEPVWCACAWWPSGPARTLHG